MKNILNGLLFLLLSAKVTAGDFYIAPQLAYGKSSSLQLFADSYEPEIFHLFSNTDDFIFLRTGATVSYGGKWFSYATGLLYSRVVIDHYYAGNLRGLNIVQLPLDCNLHVGKKLYGYLGIGAYLNYLHPQKEDSELKFSLFQPGITGSIGMGYRFNSSLAIDIVYRVENGLRPLYYLWLSTSAGPWGHAYWAEENVPFRTLTLSFKFTIGRKNNHKLQFCS